MDEETEKLFEEACRASRKYAYNEALALANIVWAAMDLDLPAPRGVVERLADTITGAVAREAVDYRKAKESSE